MILSLSLADLKHERLLSICAVAAMTAVLAPLLLLFSLRYGILSTLEHNLSSNPQNLEIRMLSGYTLPKAFFDDLRADPDVGFAVEMTRALSVSADISCNGRVKSGAECIPTAKGDPLLAFSEIADLQAEDEVVVSAAVASDMKGRAGDLIRVSISRIKDGQTQRAVHSFKIAGVLPSSLSSGYKLYLPLTVITAMEDFRDGYEPLIFSDGTHQNSARESFAKVRLYAKDIDSVKPLSDKLRAKYNIQDKLADIEELKALTRTLNFIFITIAAVSVTGGALAVGGLIFSGISRKERALALLRISGLSDCGVILMIVLENMILSTLAFIFSLLLYEAGAVAFAKYFSQALKEGMVVSKLTYGHLGIFLVASLLLCAFISAVITACRVLPVTPAQAMRNA